MTDNHAAERRALVWRVRSMRAQHLKAHYLEVEARVIPRCASCEFNHAGRCTAAPAPGVETFHRYGHTITDPDDLCILWGASYDAFSRAFSFTHGRPSPPPPYPLSFGELAAGRGTTRTRKAKNHGP